MEEVLYTSSKAAVVLHEQLRDKTIAQWETWLRNNRNGTRNAVHSIPFERVGKGAMYRAEDLAKFVVWEKSRRLGTMKLSNRAAEALHAVGFGEQGGSATGRSLDCQVVAAIDEATGRHFAQLVIRNPLLVFRLESEQVRALAYELTEMADAFDRWSKT